MKEPQKTLCWSYCVRRTISKTKTCYLLLHFNRCFYFYTDTSPSITQINPDTLSSVDKPQENVPDSKEATTHDQIKQVVASGWTLWLYKKGGWTRRRTDGQAVKVSVLKSFISRRKPVCLMNNAGHGHRLPAQGWLRRWLPAPKLFITPLILLFCCCFFSQNHQWVFDTCSSERRQKGNNFIILTNVFTFHYNYTKYN